MSNHKVHETLPDGFCFADRLQIEAFMATGSIPGASKVCLVSGAGELPRLATRLRPPRDWEDSLRLDYKEGWKDGKALAPSRHTSGDLDTAYAGGYRDAAENRMKWHLAHCPDHGDHESGCGA